jgi:uncharacterized membrane protein YcaP (DUF421 family)
VWRSPEAEKIAASFWARPPLSERLRAGAGNAICCGAAFHLRSEVFMFDMSAPWWELPARAAIIYAVLLVLVRLSGKRTVGQFTPFDLLVVMLLSESVSSGLSGGEESVTGGLLAAATLIVLNLGVAVVTARSGPLQNLAEGTPVLIGREGRVYTEALRKHHVPMLDMERALREADCDLKEMKYAFLEADGGISVLKDSSGEVQQKDGHG